MGRLLTCGIMRSGWPLSGNGEMVANRKKATFEYPKNFKEMSYMTFSWIHTLRKFLLIFCLVLTLAFAIAWIYLFNYYHDGHLPNFPQPSIGRLYPSNNHGSFVYLTQSENDLLNRLAIFIPMPFFLGFVVNKKWRIFTDPLEGYSPEQRYKILRGPRKP